MNFNSNKLYRVPLYYHVVFWLTYFLFNTFRWGSYFNDYLYSLKTNLLGFPIHMTLCYLNILIFMPYLVYRKKYVLYVLAVLSAIFLMVLVKFNLTYLLITHNVWPEGPQTIDKLTLNYTIDMMMGELYVITFVTAIKITLDFLKEQKRVTDLEKSQLETELLFLKSQISPHFFFNTLNNIYSLSVEKSNKTPKIVLKLSELMRYMLYDTSGKKQSLENEILCIQNYLDLERIRNDERLEVNMEVSGDIHDKEISPVILLTFVENAFKHGVNKNTGKVRINIDFKVKGDFLHFTISNPTPEITQHQDNFNKSSGIGIENVKKRLELGYNKNDYKLSFKNKKNIFVVKLVIKVT
ncbi:sensor histidine kinase [Flavobacterium sp. WLB]|uniref:Histidine kinase n=1 Tax=Flavobacterium panici TaxID=2654843 RepID=A0A9N8P2T4_9FLAO|nr:MULTISPECIES: histidine kinase [Flavobacterium]KOP39242.1 histidine kinase [Flavobacterium sp. VMW]MDR6764588.1 sensor histidine kinase YesM [Flavobacterium sp. 2755]OWU89092.1 histidine kinase [Flavobacterium sp. NLM]PUU71658.1 sensor histidine kinase [Flavobacterium sp. WLB]CAC9975571.1 histidine kinase [Flavobacterium panici]